MIEQYQKLVMNKKLTLLELAREMSNISKACKIMGYSRQQYYNIKQRFLSEGEAGLKNKSRRPRKHPRQATSDLQQLILDYVLQYPSYSYQRLRDTLFTEEGVLVTEGVVRGVFNRHGLNRFKDRLRYLEKEYYARGLTLSKEQIFLLSRISEKIEYEHIYAPCSGYLLSQDTFYVGYLKGVGKVYMQSVIDCANSFAFAKIYTSKDGLTAAHVLQDRVFPFYYHMGMKIHHILTDNGTEYCGLDDHPYELFLQLFQVEHRTTRIKSPHTNGFVERFHQTVLREFFQVAFRKKFYASVNDLQSDLDVYMYRYNFKRAHRGYRLNGKTPIQGFMGNLFAPALPSPN